MNVKHIVKITKKIFDFKNTNILHLSATLSFHSILSLIPLLFVSFFLLTKLPSFKEYSSSLTDFLLGALIPAQKQNIVSYLEGFLQKSTSLEAFGAFAMFFTAISFFMTYESIVSSISKTQKRSFFAALSTYWTLFTLTPIGLISSFYLSHIIQDFLNAHKIGFNFLGIFPYLLIWGLYYLSLNISINKRLNKKITLVCSFIASLIWYLGKTVFVYYIASNKVYVNLYGSFSILFFFFMWIYISWIIFLNTLNICSLLSEINFKSFREDILQKHTKRSPKA